MTSSIKFPVPDKDLVSIKDIIPYENNAKLHDEAGVERIARAITSTGYFDQPIVVDENNVIIKGHGRRLAAIKLKLPKVWVIKNDSMTETAKKAARIQDNLVARGDMDESLLYTELEEIAKAGDFSFADLGLSDIELETFNSTFVFDGHDDLLGELDALGEEEEADAETKEVKIKEES